MQKNRHVSNIELLRILSIFLITMHHLVYSTYSYIGLFLFGFQILISCSMVGIIVEKIWKMIESRSHLIFDCWKNPY